MKTGWLAKEFGGENFELQVLQSAAGYYLGTLDKDGLPYSRESQQYFPDEDTARKALETGTFIQRKHP